MQNYLEERCILKSLLLLYRQFKIRQNRRRFAPQIGNYLIGSFTVIKTAAIYDEWFLVFGAGSRQQIQHSRHPGNNHSHPKEHLRQGLPCPFQRG